MRGSKIAQGLNVGLGVSLAQSQTDSAPIGRQIMKRKQNTPPVTPKHLAPRRQTAPTTQKLDPRYAAALARGEIARRKLAAAEGGPISPAKVARLFGVTERTVVKRWCAFRLIAWRDEKGIHFPVWQFREGKLLTGVEAVLQVFRSEDQWRVMLYFLGARLSLNGQRPLDMLRRGESAKLVAHAKALAEDGLW
jgi:hypothetical protein